jgi:imidazolonepropionase-like amidohydrolase
MPRLIVAASLLLASSAGAQAARENIAVPNNGPTTLPLGTTRGERANRLIIRGATVLSGRGTPGTNLAMPPEGPVDIVIENGVITDMIPMDAVNAAGYGRNFQRATGDKVIDATGQYVMPGLVVMPCPR